MLIALEIAFAVITLELGYFSHENTKYDEPDWVDDFKHNNFKKERQIYSIMRKLKYI